MHRQNLRRHQSKCEIKNSFNTSYREIVEALNFRNNHHVLDSINLRYERVNKFIQKVYREIEEMLQLSREIDCQKKIDELVISEGTKFQYKTDWSSYFNWCKSQNLDPYQSNSANSYLAQLKNKLSTIKNKRNRLQSMLRLFLNSSVNLRPIRRRISFKPKYSLSHKELLDYLHEQEEINGEDHFIQLLLSIYGCRINTIASLQRKHLTFLNGGNKMILPDSKTGPREVEVPDEIQDKFTEFLEEREIEEEEAFLFSASTTNIRKRSIQICRRINKRIKESNVLKKTSTHAFSTHMFRKSKAFNMFKELVEEAKEKVRSEIGQADKSRSVDYYIYN